MPHLRQLLQKHDANFTNTDIKRISAHLDMSQQAFKSQMAKI
jgi:hypothetical protein